MDINNLIGKRVRYLDYANCERFGIIKCAEPTIFDPSICYLYIEDDDPDEEIITEMVNGVQVSFTIMITSEEAILDEED